MSADLGLDQLTDDQLVEFWRAMVYEIARRGGLVQQAAEDATASARADYVDAQAAAATRADRAWATQWDDLACVKRVALMIEQTLGAGWRFTAWRSATGERRVYLDGPQGDQDRMRPSDRIRAHHGKPPRRAPSARDKVSFTVDGSGSRAPGHLEIEGAALSAQRHKIEGIVRFIAARWDQRSTVAAQSAAMTGVTAAPPPSYFY